MKWADSEGRLATPCRKHWKLMAIAAGAIVLVLGLWFGARSEFWAAISAIGTVLTAWFALQTVQASKDDQAAARKDAAEQLKEIRRQLELQVRMAEPDLEVRMTFARVPSGPHDWGQYEHQPAKMKDILHVAASITNRGGNARHFRFLCKGLTRWQPWLILPTPINGRPGIADVAPIFDDPYFVLGPEETTTFALYRLMDAVSPPPLKVHHRLVIEYRNRSGEIRSIGWQFAGEAPSDRIGVRSAVKASTFEPNTLDAIQPDVCEPRWKLPSSGTV